MTSKKNIISFPDNLNITLSGIDTMRLHEHGQAIFVHLSFDEKLSSIQSSFLIKQILKKGMLDFQLTDFMFNRAKGFHGPFKSKLLKNSDFKKIDEDNFFGSVVIRKNYIIFVLMQVLPFEVWVHIHLCPLEQCVSFIFV